MTGCNVPLTEWWIVYPSVTQHWEDTHTFCTKSKAKMIIWLFQRLILSSFFLTPRTSNNFYNETYNNYSLLHFLKLEPNVPQVLNATKICKKQAVLLRKNNYFQVNYVLDIMVNYMALLNHIQKVSRLICGPKAGYLVWSFSSFSSDSPGECWQALTLLSWPYTLMSHICHCITYAVEKVSLNNLRIQAD